MIKTVFFIVTAYGSIIDWAGPVPSIGELTPMEVCIETAGRVHQRLLIAAEDGVDKRTGKEIPVADIKMGCYNVAEEPVIGETFD